MHAECSLWSGGIIDTQHVDNLHLWLQILDGDLVSWLISRPITHVSGKPGEQYLGKKKNFLAETSC